MKTLEIDEASLSEYGSKEETWVLTRRGKPVAAVVPIRPGVDPETLALSHNPEFIKIINRSWKDYEEHGGISMEEMRRKHGIPRKPARRKSSGRSR
jgi:antitoxin (DNA-binding transcriptional repressor) of toxin-antitoxin stability system